MKLMTFLQFIYITIFPAILNLHFKIKQTVDETVELPENDELK